MLIVYLYVRGRDTALATFVAQVELAGADVVVGGNGLIPDPTVAGGGHNGLIGGVFIRRSDADITSIAQALAHAPGRVAVNFMRIQVTDDHIRALASQQNAALFMFGGCTFEADALAPLAEAGHVSFVIFAITNVDSALLRHLPRSLELLSLLSCDIQSLDFGDGGSRTVSALDLTGSTLSRHAWGELSRVPELQRVVYDGTRGPGETLTEDELEAIASVPELRALSLRLRPVPKDILMRAGSRMRHLELLILTDPYFSRDDAEALRRLFPDIRIELF